MNIVSNRRLEGLDVLRGIAATMIIFFHVLYLGGFSEKIAFTSVVSKLDIGVRLFYALSAFSLMYAYENRINIFDGFKKFYISRFFRIAPLFYVCIIFYSIALPTLYNTNVKIEDIFLNLTFTFGLLPGKNESIVWAGWSIGVEWIFYFLFPLFIVICSNMRRTLVTFAASIIIFINFSSLGDALKMVSNGAYELHFLNQLVYFVTGILSYRLYKLIELKTKWVTIVISTISIIIMYLYFFTELIPGPLDDMSMAINFILILLLFSYFSPKILVNKFLINLGASSFGLYLLHPIVLILFSKIDLFSKISFLSSNMTVLYLIYFLCTFLLTFFLAYVSYRFFEQPMMKLGKKLG